MGAHRRRESVLHESARAPRRLPPWQLPMRGQRTAGLRRACRVAVRVPADGRSDRASRGGDCARERVTGTGLTAEENRDPRRLATCPAPCRLSPARRTPSSETRCCAVPQHGLASARSGKGASARHGDLRSVRHGPIPPVHSGRDRRGAGAPLWGTPRTRRVTAAGSGSARAGTATLKRRTGCKPLYSWGFRRLADIGENAIFALVSRPTHRADSPPRNTATRVSPSLAPDSG